MNIPGSHWIWMPDWKELVNDRPRLVRFRKAVCFDVKPGSLKLKISADTRYKLYVNGHFVEFGPAKGDQRIWYVDTVEIAPWLCAGENVIAAEVLRYPLAYRSGNFGMLRTPTPGLYVEEVSSRDDRIIADSSWKCCEVAGYRIVRENPGFSPLVYLEDYTADLSDRNWKCCGYPDEQWANAREYRDFMEINVGACPGDLTPRPIPFLNKIPGKFLGVVPRYDDATAACWDALLRGAGSITVPAGTTQTIEINAGEEMCGYLSLRLTGGVGAQIKIMCAEAYSQKQSADRPRGRTKTDRSDWKNGYLDGYTDCYRPAGFGTQEDPEVYEPFWFRTFRFVQLEIQAGSEDCTIVGFDYLETGYPLEVKAKATASDSSFDGIWDISLRTLKRCMHETYVDCPFYEQLQYAMDSRSEILYTYMVSGDDRLARQCMDDFRRSQREDGMVNCCYPQLGPNIIPGFGIYYIMMVYDHMMYFGDRKLIKKHLGAIDGVLGFFDDHLDPRGMVGKVGGFLVERYWSFIDWAKPWGESAGTPPCGLRGSPLTMESLLYIMGLQHAAKLCDYVGRTGTAAEYRERAAAVQKAVNTYCRDEDGFYLDGPGVKEYSQHCQVYALLTDTVSVEEGRPLLLKTLEETDKFAQCTVASMFYVFRALEKIGAYDRTEEKWNIWRNMLKDDLTTCVESEPDGRSDCHAWGSLILHELHGVILGVRPGAPGYEKVEIAPVSGYLTWAKGDVATKWGNIHVEWKKAPDGKLELEYRVPDGIRDKVIVKI